MDNQVVIKQISALGAVVNVELGFKPVYARVINRSDKIIWEYFGGGNMAAGYAIKQTTDGVITYETSNGFTEYDGDATHAPGLSISATIAANGKTLECLFLRGYEIT